MASSEEDTPSVGALLREKKSTIVPPIGAAAAAAGGAGSNANANASATATNGTDESRKKKAAANPAGVAGARSTSPAATDYAQLTAQYGSTGKKAATRGRKSIRQIAEGLQKKIELYKSSQVEMEMFLKRVEKFMEEARLRANNDIIRNNKATVDQYSPETRRKILETEVGRPQYLMGSSNPSIHPFLCDQSTVMCSCV